MKYIASLSLFLPLLVFGQAELPESQSVETDICIYGGTSAGIVAGIQVLAMGKSVVVIEPSSREGGLTTGGLGQTDIGNKQVIGGLSREFYERIAAYYAKPEAWKWQKREEYRDSGQTRTAEGESSMWTFEPSAALEVYREWIDETGLNVVRSERLNRETGVEMEGDRIVSIAMESGRVFKAKMFIDATYEGDLMAAADVSYTFGREANAQYGETLNGVQTRMAKHHNFVDGVDPYRVKGDPSSGLLPFLDPDGPGEEGEADKRIQAYCFRMCLTDHPENRIPFHKPEGYDEDWYELLLRNFEAGENGMPWINSSMPNRKTDTNNRTGFSTDFIGQNYDYPEASYAEREAIVKRHRLYQQGLMWTLANHPRVPDKIRNEVARWGVTKDEFVEGNGWQEQLYVREARRMVSDFVMTQNHCQQRETVDDSVGMGAYTMDSHNVQRYVTKEGWAKNEGDVQVGGFPPYPISFRSIVPKKEEAENLLVPVCLSASHITFGSIRMEPVFMVLGQSAATAASLAIDDEVALQDVEYAELRERLLADGQILEYDAPPRQSNRAGIDPKSLKGIVIDNEAAKLKGSWVTNNVTHPRVGETYVHDNNEAKGECVARYETELEPGEYDVRLLWPPNPNRATNVPVTVHTGPRELEKTKINQKEGGEFVSVGRFMMGGKVAVEISNAGTNGYVIADAVQFLPVAEVEKNVKKKSVQQAAPDAPNFLLLFADDLGYEALNCYGGLDFSTPNLDRLASEGMRFTRAYTSPVCTPSRMSLYTGTYTARHGYYNVLPVHKGTKKAVDFKNQWPTYAQVLRQAGYATSVTGKWQLATLEFHPDHIRDAGFDSWCVWQIWKDGAKTTRYWDPCFNHDGKVREDIAERFGPDVLAEYVIGQMKSAKKAGRPFFVHHNMLLPHWPITPMPAEKAAGEGGSLAGMIAYMDKLCGKIVDAVDESGLAENTFVIFMGDNGTEAFGEPRRTKSGIVEGGKTDLTDAGTHIPLIVRRPGRIEAGEVADDLIDMADWFPTFCELAGLNVPEDVTLDGISFAGRLLRGEPSKREYVTAGYGGKAKVFDGEKWMDWEEYSRSAE